jgi:hypothetical protein
MSTGNGNKTAEIRAAGLRIVKDRLIVELTDGREVSVPLDRYPSLLGARPGVRNAWQMIGPGKAFHWPELDLDLSLAGLVAGLPELMPAPPKRRKASSIVMRKAS